MSLERAEAVFNLHRAVYCLALLILNLKLKDYLLIPNHIFFPEVIHIITLI